MPDAITREDVVAIAALAELELAPEEIDTFTRELAAILRYADQVQQVDTTGVPPTSSTATVQSSGRADEVQPSLDPAAALANAPEPASGAGLFKVPRVIG